MRDTKDSELLHFSSLNFVIFATFVVNVLFLFWLRLRRARTFVALWLVAILYFNR